MKGARSFFVQGRAVKGSVSRRNGAGRGVLVKIPVSQQECKSELRQQAICFEFGTDGYLGEYDSGQWMYVRYVVWKRFLQVLFPTKKGFFFQSRLFWGITTSNTCRWPRVFFFLIGLAFILYISGGTSDDPQCSCRGGRQVVVFRL